MHAAGQERRELKNVALSLLSAWPFFNSSMASVNVVTAVAVASLTFNTAKAVLEIYPEEAFKSKKLA